MLKVKSIVAESYTDTGIRGIAEIIVSSTSDLATTDGSVVFTDGSIAWNVTTGDFYGLYNGVWYNQDGSGAVT